MRRRFFLTILAVLLIVTAGSIYTHSIFLKQERLRLIDQQVRETASALVGSELADLRKINFEEADAIISEELGESRIGKFFIIRNAQDEIIFKSTSAQVLSITEIPRKPQWIQLNSNGKYLRILNLQLPRFQDRTLQVGLVLDENLTAPNYFSLSSVAFIAMVLAIGFFATLFLTSFLLKPIARLENFISKVSDQSRTNPLLPSVPSDILSDSNATSHDEFNKMVTGLNVLISKVNMNYQFSRIWGYQMAHELKTPLALLNMEIEKLQKRTQLGQSEMQGVLGEVGKMSETIGSFLSWAELENSSPQKHLFVNRLGSITLSICDRVQRNFPNRIVLNIMSDPVVISSPQHLEQLLSNLVLNALSYSPLSTHVMVNITSDSLSVCDSGRGIPRQVLERLGEPFNRGESGQGRTKGHGLGLAWVNSVCRLYSWDLKIASTGHGTNISITFPGDNLISEIQSSAI
ncbi:MAG: HAMP domain-containing histidine kinase [Bdellovibrio sp.]|nr:HAMP domain-containing histidine kinase [Bdellovibrio sp.]